jgi:hypothetical protein
MQFCGQPPTLSCRKIECSSTLLSWLGFLKIILKLNQTWHLNHFILKAVLTGIPYYRHDRDLPARPGGRGGGATAARQEDSHQVLGGERYQQDYTKLEGQQSPRDWNFYKWFFGGTFWWRPLRSLLHGHTDGKLIYRVKLGNQIKSNQIQISLNERTDGRTHGKLIYKVGYNMEHLAWFVDIWWTSNQSENCETVWLLNGVLNDVFRCLNIV